jgi:hypothetical protein
VKYRKIKVGDLVHHSLYRREEWCALLLKMRILEEDGLEMAYVKMVPGTMQYDYFQRTGKNNSDVGWVYSKWLWVYQRED